MRLNAADNHVALVSKLLLSSLQSLQLLLDDLLLLDKESTENAVLNAVGAPGTSVAALHLLLRLGERRQLVRAVRLYAKQLVAAVTYALVNRVVFLIGLPYRIVGSCRPF